MWQDHMERCMKDMSPEEARQFELEVAAKLMSKHSFLGAIKACLSEHDSLEEPEQSSTFSIATDELAAITLVEDNPQETSTTSEAPTQGKSR